MTSQPTYGKPASCSTLIHSRSIELLAQYDTREQGERSASVRNHHRTLFL